MRTFEKNLHCCANCAFFDKFKVQKKEDNIIGACHANPPVPIAPDPYMNDDEKSKTSKLGIWPLVLGDFWCGVFTSNTKTGE